MSVEKLKQLRTEMDTLQAEFDELGKKVFEDTVQDLFKKHEEFETLSFTQYSPYFNDGEPCTFSCNALGEYGAYQINEISTDDTYSDEEAAFNNLDWVKAVQEALNEVLSLYKDSDFETYYGEGEVIATRDGVSVEYYEHD